MTFIWFDHIIAFVLLVVLQAFIIRNVYRGNTGVEEDIEENEDDVEEEQFDPNRKKHAKQHRYYLQGFILLTGALLVVTSWNFSGRPWEYLGIRWPEINATSLLFIGILLLFQLLDIIYHLWWQKDAKEYVKSVEFVMPIDWSEFRHFLFMCIAAGIGEEIIYRGFLVTYLQFYLGIFVSNTYLLLFLVIILTCIDQIPRGWFGFLKGSSLVALQCLVFVKTQSLLPVIFIHVFIDVLSGVATIIAFNQVMKSEAKHEASE